MKISDSQLNLFSKAWGRALSKIDYLIDNLKERTPHITEQGKWKTLSPDYTAGLYDGKWEHGNWTGGFWAGLLWLAYRYTGDKSYSENARLWAERFSFRKVDENTHDLGFIFFPSHVLGYMWTSDFSLRDNAIAAANTLVKRFSEEAGLLQAWGSVQHEELGGSSAIDTMMNLPLLWWAGDETGDEVYSDIARTHALSSVNAYLRDDGSTFHVVYFDRRDGKIVKRTTFQGLADDSCWSRGQAWAISGWAIAYHYTHHEAFLNAAEKAINYYWSNLPNDLVPFWDFDDPKIPNTIRDSSAAAITAHGLLDLAEIHPDEVIRIKHFQQAIKVLESLSSNYLSPVSKGEEGIVLHACYSKPHNQGVDSSVIWGDYFYLFGLLRVLGSK